MKKVVRFDLLLTVAECASRLCISEVKVMDYISRGELATADKAIAAGDAARIRVKGTDLHRFMVDYDFLTFSNSTKKGKQ